MYYTTPIACVPQLLRLVTDLLVNLYVPLRSPTKLLLSSMGLFVALAGLAAVAGSAAQDHLKNINGDSYTATPAGWVLSHCVHDIPSDAQIERNGTIVTVRDPPGAAGRAGTASPSSAPPPRVRACTWFNEIGSRGSCARQRRRGRGLRVAAVRVLVFV